MTKSHDTTPAHLPPIQGQLLDTLMEQADEATGRQRVKNRVTRVLPDISNHTAKLTLVLLTICALVPFATALIG